MRIRQPARKAVPPRCSRISWKRGLLGDPYVPDEDPPADAVFLAPVTSPADAAGTGRGVIRYGWTLAANFGGNACAGQLAHPWVLSPPTRTHGGPWRDGEESPGQPNPPAPLRDGAWPGVPAMVSGSCIATTTKGGANSAARCCPSISTLPMRKTETASPLPHTGLCKPGTGHERGSSLLE